MAQKKLSRPSTVLFLTLLAELTLGLSWTIPAQAQFVPPNLGAPKTTAGGATRSGSCVVGKTSLIALVPNSKIKPVGRIGLTTQERPTIFVYLPKTNAQSAEFILKDVEEEDVYRTTVPISGQQGVVGFKLPADAPALEVNKDYQWFFNVICQPSDRLRDVFVSAWIKRVEPNTTLMNGLKNSKPRQRPNLYAQAGIWQDTLTALSELRRSSPSDKTVTDEWNTLLKSIGLGDVPGGPPNGQLSLTTPKPR